MVWKSFAFSRPVIVVTMTIALTQDRGTNKGGIMTPVFIAGVNWTRLKCVFPEVKNWAAKPEEFKLPAW